MRHLFNGWVAVEENSERSRRLGNYHYVFALDIILVDEQRQALLRGEVVGF